MLYTCVKTIKAVTATHVRLFNKWPPSYTHHPVWQLSGKQTSGKSTSAGMSITDRWPSFSAHADCTLSCSLLLSRDERNWATALSGWCRADYRPSQWRLRNRISPRRPPVEGAQPCVTHALQTMQLCSLLNARPWGTMTDRIANAGNWIRIRIYKSNFEFSNFV